MREKKPRNASVSARVGECSGLPPVIVVAVDLAAVGVKSLDPAWCVCVFVCLFVCVCGRARV